MLITMIWLLAMAPIAEDVARGRGRLTLALVACFAAYALFAPVVLPVWVGALLTLGAAKGLGARLEWRPFGLAMITTPSRRALPPAAI